MLTNLLHQFPVRIPVLFLDNQGTECGTQRLTDAGESATIKAQKGILPIDGQFRKLVTKKVTAFLGLKGGYFFVWFMYAIKIETMIPRIIRTTVSSS